MTSQHLNNKIGNAVGECKRRMLNRLKAGGDLEEITVRFMDEIRLALSIILQQAKNVSAEIVQD